MRILVTGGTGVIGAGVIHELLGRGHSVRLLSRHAREDARQWDGVEAFAGDIADAKSIAGAAADIDLVLHIAGIAEESDDATFQSINVEGSRHVLDEAKSAGVQRFVYVSSLGADVGESDYHKSKFAAEQLVERSGLTWTIVRPGNVYGPGDEVVSLVLKMVRALPAVPVIDSGDQEFQPIWHEDLAKILASVCERDDLASAVLEAAGRDITTMNDLLARFGEITGRKPLRIPVPMALAELTTRLGSLAVRLPVDENKLTMLSETNVVRGRDAAETVGIDPIPLDDGLRLLADALEEALPEEGVGSLEHKRFYADIAGSSHSPASLMTLFRNQVTTLMPIEFAAEPGAAERIEQGATLTGSLPLRGNFQVRVEVAEPTHVVFATIEGHPLAGIVEFTTSEVPGGIRFAVEVFARPSNMFDLIAVRTVGAPAQNANWRTLVRHVVEASGGTSDGVEQETRSLDEQEAQSVERRVRSMVQRRHREEQNGDSMRPDGR